MIKVLVLFNAARPRPGRGDAAAERGTIRAAEQAAAALKTAGLRPRLLPVYNCLADLVRRLGRPRPDVVVNLCEGFAGHPSFEAQVAGVLELMGLPFTGNPSPALLLCQDKFRAKAILNAWGLPTPRGWLAAPGLPLPARLRFPLIVKPCAEDASIGIGPESVVRSPAALRRQAAQLARRYRRPALVEAFIDGPEFYVSVWETPSGFRVLPVAEIGFEDLPPGVPRIVGYEAKWKPSSPWYRQTEPVCPAPLPPRQTRRLGRLALAACAALRIRGYARVDLRLDRRGRPFILEVNPNPDTSLEAGWAQSLEAAGIAYEAFWENQVRWALQRSARQRRV